MSDEWNQKDEEELSELEDDADDDVDEGDTEDELGGKMTSFGDEE